MYLNEQNLSNIGGSISFSSHNLHFWCEEFLNKGFCLVVAISPPEKHNTRTPRESANQYLLLHCNSKLQCIIRHKYCSCIIRPPFRNSPVQVQQVQNESSKSCTSPCPVQVQFLSFQLIHLALLQPKLSILPTCNQKSQSIYIAEGRPC